jgi:hypothetical protein
MSINLLANAATARRLDFAPLGTFPQDLAGIAAAATTTPTPLSATAPASPIGAPPSSTSGNAVNTALHVLFGYIPTEILTLYVAVLAALHQPNKISQAEWNTFWVFLIATPIVVWLVYSAKVMAAKKPTPLAPSQWPIWEMFAATVAYFAWAFALPNTPLSEYSWYSSAIAAIVVLIASTVLGLIAPFFQRPINP